MHLERKRRLLHPAATLAWVLLATGSAAAAPLAVLELFTSQGCASCPPADALFEDYAEGGEVIALSLSVDYWDYLGWTDTLALPENTERQHDYATALGDGTVYTPQVIVNGRRQVVGSDKAAIDAAIAELAAADEGVPVPVEIGYDPEHIVVRVGEAPAAAVPATIWLVFFTADAEVAVERGENAGATLGYYNVVRAMQAIGTWWGRPMTIEVPLSEIERHGADGCAALVQAEAGGLPGPILGAGIARIDPARW